MLTAEHRPATRRRRYRHDDLIAVDLFSGYGGLTRGIEAAGFTMIMAANHNRYKVEVHEANHPHAEHWVADLVDPESGDYHDVRDLPAADILGAGVSCVNHSQANTKKAYAQGLSLFDLDDPDFDDRVTRSEKDRATANCVLHYAAKHHPRMIIVECTTELTSWGPALLNKPKVGDGSTFRWWLNQFDILGYKHRILYLNSQFFGVPQSRDRLYIVMWDRKIPAPDLDHRPESWCGNCDSIVEAVWSWKTGVPPTGSVRYGKQYNYRCPRCHREVVPPMTPSLAALDLSNLGTRIGDRKKPLAPATMARAERCRQRFAEFPAVLMPAKAAHGAEKHIGQPMATQTSQQETAILSTGAIMQMANSYEHPGSNCRTRDLGQPLWTQPATNTTGILQPGIALAVNNFQGAQGGSETLALVSSGVLPFRKHTTPTTHAEAMPTVTSDQIPGIITAAGLVQFRQGSDRRVSGVDRPLNTVVADGASHGLMFSGWFKQNGTSPGQFPAPHPLSDPLGAQTSQANTGLLLAEWREQLADLTLDDCYFRMMAAHEVGRGCGFNPDFGDHAGDFIVWGTARQQVDGYGNAVSPPVGEWIGRRCRAVLHGEPVAA